ncbi:MAG TPA: stage II sporulation protein M [Acidimicrobiales bacterium]|jgi:uncharacterized membrane protein SpoIIM required for sporulation|nr:stage II sporulation protein M [Acidimicrobiales bacterium]
MDIDQFLTRHSGSWARLEELTKRAGHNARRLSTAELDELIRLYQRASAHLSYASTNFADPGLAMRLSRVVSQSGAVVYGTRPRTWRSFGRFFHETLPAALWYSRRFLLASAVLTFVPALAFGVWLANSPRAIDATAPAAVRQALIDHDFTDYYRSAPSVDFATQVYTNNVEVSLEAFAGGVLLLPTAVLLVINGANIGVAGGLFAAAGQPGKFWGSVIPHGLIELTSVVIAGAAGLALGWALVDPGDRPRRQALAEAGRRSIVLILGTVFTLAVAGTIEGFVTGSSLPTAVRVGIGVAVEVAFVAYVALCGRAAHRKGLTGTIGEAEGAGWAKSLTDRSYNRPVALARR